MMLCWSMNMTRRNGTLEKVIDAEQFFQVSHQAMLHRLVARQADRSGACRGVSADYRFDGSGETGRRKGIILSDRKKSAIFYDWRIHSESGADDREGFYFKRKKGRTLDRAEAYRADIVYDFDGGGIRTE